MNFGRPSIASQDEIRERVKKASESVDSHKFSHRFLMNEWSEVIDAWQLKTWESYRDVKRLGRKTRLPEKQRAILWAIFDQVQSDLKHKNLLTESEIFTRLTLRCGETKHPPFEFIVVDEAQDISIAQLRFLAALGAGRPNSLFFTGDLGQRIFQQPFPWKALGIDIRGRSSTLRINYRTSHQIRIQADRLLAPELSDVDGNVEKRTGTISIFNGPKPNIMVLENSEDEILYVKQWLSDRILENLKPHEIAVFVRSDAQLDRARSAVENAALPYIILDERAETSGGNITISTMHLAKGLEFRAVAVIACDDDIIPSMERIETVTDETDLEEVYHTERHLLYVACTRAREQLLVTGVGIRIRR